MEDEDDVEGDEFLSRDGEGQADEDGVEYHAEFEDTDRCHLRGVVFHFMRRFVGFKDGCFLGGWTILVIVVDVLPAVGEVVFAGGMGLGRGAAGGLVDMTVVCCLTLVIGVSERGEGSIAHSHQLNEEEHKDGHEGDAFGPVIVGYWTCEAWICEGIAGRSEEMDEGSGDYDAGAEVLGNEECTFRYSYLPMATRIDWEHGTCSHQ